MQQLLESMYWPKYQLNKLLVTLQQQPKLLRELNSTDSMQLLAFNTITIPQQ